MRVLIVEDDFISRRLLKTVLSAHADCDVAVNGEEAIQAYELALEEECPYDLICMDIMMPNVDGQQALEEIRRIEGERGLSGPKEVKVIMISALNDPKTVIEAYYHGGATSYLTKPIDAGKLLEEVRSLGLVS